MKRMKRVLSMTLAVLLASTLINTRVVYADESANNTTVSDVAASDIEATEAPMTEAPETETPETETPETETPVAEMPEAEALAIDLPAAELPTADMPTVDAPRATMPSVESPDVSAAPTADGTMPTPEDPGIGSILPVQDHADGPCISVAPKLIDMGKAFDPMKGVYAFDDVDGNITSLIVVERNTVNVNVENIYEVDYAVTNSRGKTTRVTVEIEVYDADRYYHLNLTTTDFTIVQNDYAYLKIRDNIRVTNEDGSIADPSTYEIYVNGGYDCGVPGVYEVSIVVISDVTYTWHEETLTITVLKGLTLEASDRTVYESSVFNPLEGVTAYETNSDLSTTPLGTYDGLTDMGLLVIGTVDTTTPGDYTLTYRAKNSKGVVESKNVTITVVARFAEITAQDQEVAADVDVTDEMIKSWATVTDPVDGSNLDVSYTLLDGPIDSSVVGSEYQIEYTYTNSAGNTTTKVITVTIIARYAAIEAADQTVLVGTEITDEMIKGWATVSDPVDGDSLPVEYTVTEGTIDTSVVGTYTIVYTYTNSAGNTTTKTITLRVAEEITTPDPGTDDTTNNNSGNGNATANKTSTSKSGTSSSPVKTGDSSNIVLYVSLLLAALLFAAVAFISKKRKQNLI